MTKYLKKSILKIEWYSLTHILSTRSAGNSWEWEYETTVYIELGRRNRQILVLSLHSAFIQCRIPVSGTVMFTYSVHLSTTNILL